MQNFYHSILTLSSKRKARQILLSLFLLFLFPLTSKAQFYTGSELSFGRKRVQYEKFFWSYYRFNGFDVYFYKQGKNLALYTSNYVQNHLREMQKRVGFQSQDAMRFIIFNRLTDYRQNNIGYVDENNYNTGGVTKFLGNKIFLYFNGDYVDFERQIREGIASILIDQSLKGTTTASQYKSSYLMHLPTWFTGGLAAYYANPWDIALDERMQISIQQKKFKYITALTGEEAIFAGHSFWYFVAQTYGEDAVARCIRVLASERSMEKAVAYALNIKFKVLLKNWRDFYLDRDHEGKRDEIPREDVLKRTNRNERVYQQLVLSPDGKNIAYVSNYLGRAIIHLYNLESGKRRKIYKMGASIDDKPDYTYPILAWHPDSKVLGIATEKKGQTTLHLYALEKGKKEILAYNMDFYEKILDFNFAENGRSLAVSAVKLGQSDIFQFFLGAGTSKQITFDIYDDLHPRFLPGSSQIVFSSNRLNDSILKNEKFEKAPSLSNEHRLYLYDLESNATELFNLTPNKEINYGSPENYAPGFLAFLNNEDGITNMSLGKFGKEILSIDTTIHYRQTFDFKTITNYPAGLKSIRINPELGKNAEILSLSGKNVLQTIDLEEPKTLYALTAKKNTPTDYRKYLLTSEEKARLQKIYADSIHRADSIALVREMLIDTVADSDTTNTDKLIKKKRRTFMSLRQSRTSDIAHEMMKDGIDVEGLTFEKTDSNTTQNKEKSPKNKLTKREKNTNYTISSDTNNKDVATYSEETKLPDFIEEDSNSLPKNEYQRIMRQIHHSMGLQTLSPQLSDSLFPKVPPKQRTYHVQYSINEATAQLGFSFLNAAYQQFTNSKNPIYLNPGATGLMKISLSDLMENHRIIGGFGFSFDFSSTEYLFSYENLEKRLGKQFVFHTLNLNQNSQYPAYKQNSYDVYFILKYPITEVSLLKGTVFGRYDRTVFKSLDYPTLVEPNQIASRLGLRGEWIYDHSRAIAKNIFYGTRGKTWVEYYQGVGKSSDNIFVLGADFRNYQRLFKTLIWANRIAVSTSFGKSKLLYYMGGVDGWMLPKFNRDVEVDQTQTYAYQTLATNLRGFSQNIRNGNSMFVINSEIRFPIFACLAKAPLKNNFLRSFQIVCFGDIGSAWSDWNPWSKDNQFYKKKIEDGPLTITLEKDANPIVGGFGGGLRAEVLGYFIRADCAWGVENGIVYKRPVFYLSFSMDF